MGCSCVKEKNQVSPDLSPIIPSDHLVSSQPYQRLDNLENEEREAAVQLKQDNSRLKSKIAALELRLKGSRSEVEQLLALTLRGRPELKDASTQVEQSDFLSASKNQIHTEPELPDL